MNRKPVKLKPDIGSDLMLILKETKKKIGTPKMEKNYHKACGASCSKLKIEGIINCNVSFWGNW